MFLQVQPIDPFAEEENKCMCWKAKDKIRLCKLHCTEVTTQWVNLTQGFVSGGKSLHLTLQKIAI